MEKVKIKIVKIQNQIKQIKIIKHQTKRKK